MVLGFWGRCGDVTIEPLDRGFGYTFGNSLRRVLLSSLAGAAVTSVRIEGVAHEFSTINGVKEDVTDIVLNLKEIVCRMHSDAAEIEAPLVVTGPGEVTAGDIDLPSGVEILNPETHIATLEKKTKLEIYLTIGHGRGYSPAEDNKTPDQPIGVIPIDSIFSPVKRVAYSVESARVGQRTDYDKLTLDIETDGSVDPHAALREAAEILIKYLAIFSEPERVEALREAGAGLVGAAAAGGLRRRAGLGRWRLDRRCRRDGRHPDRGAGAGRALVQLPQAGGRADRRRPGPEVRVRAERDPQLRPQVDRGGHRDARGARAVATGVSRLSSSLMRHGKQKGKLSRSSAHRKALMMNLSREVIDHERIQTTEAKAKAVKPELERLITLAKKGDQHSRRLAMARLGQDKFIVYKLFEEIAPRYAERPGGYTRILKLGPRKSDSTEMVFLELV